MYDSYFVVEELCIWDDRHPIEMNDRMTDILFCHSAQSLSAKINITKVYCDLCVLQPTNNYKPLKLSLFIYSGEIIAISQMYSCIWMFKSPPINWKSSSVNQAHLNSFLLIQNII